MSKLKIAIGINSLTESQWDAYNTHLQLFYRIGKDVDADICLVNPSRVGIDRMRNSAAAIVVNEKMDYLLFLDDDVIPPPDALKKLLEANADVAAGDVLIRSYPFDHMCFKYVDEAKTSMQALKFYPSNQRYVSVDAVGCSLTLIKRSIIEKVKEDSGEPYFITGINNTEDVYFCLKARDADPECTIVVDTTVECGHILYPQIISSGNKKFYSEYMEKQFPQVTKTKSTVLNIKKVASDANYEDLVREQMAVGR